MKLIVGCFVFAICCKVCLFAENNLKAYGADKSKSSCSGFSSGSSMATQLHVAHSSELIGAGLVAGAPYYCAHDRGYWGIFQCWILGLPVSLSDTLKEMEKYVQLNLIDPTEHIAGSKVYIYNGMYDILVNPDNGPHIEKFYQHFNANIITKFDLRAQHAMPTNDYGNWCFLFFPPFINNCNYFAAYILLNHIYGNLKEPNENVQKSKNLFKFNQEEFTVGQKTSMDSIAYVYVPTYCQKNEGCPLHIAFHGCFMGSQIIGEHFVRHAGYNDVAEVNNIIILYPQIAISFWDPINPIGCYDWYGFTDENYATKVGLQIKTIYKMMQRILTKV